MQRKQRQLNTPYTPPHRRTHEPTAVSAATGTSVSPADAQGGPAQLGLNHITVHIILPAESEWSSCPFSCLMPQDSEQSTHVEERRLSLPDEDNFADELLEWFSAQTRVSSEQISEKRYSISLDASLSKQRRKMWHRLAEQHQLQSVSQGAGDERHLVISLPDNAAAPRVSARAIELWKLAQEAGGRHWELSQNEVQQHIDEGTLPPELSQLALQRDQAEELSKLIKNGSSPAALVLLSQHPGLVWVRAQGSDYPLVTACQQGLYEVVEFIVLEVPSAKQQRSRRYESLEACIRRHRNAVTRNRLLSALQL